MKSVIRIVLIITGISLGFLNGMSKEPNFKWIKDAGSRIFPDKKTVYNVTDYGAIPDGVTMNTPAIQQAIDNCSTQGGGIVTFSPGNYLTGSIYLKEGVHLVIPKGTTLLGSTDLKDYPEMNTRIAGIEMAWPSALINVLNQKKVMISGEGVVHAQGKVFWQSYWAMREDYETKGLRWIVDYDCKRPRTLLISNSSDVSVKQVTFQQAGFWTIHVLYSSYCTVDGVVIQNNIGGHGPSTDGVDIDSSAHILIENCDIDCNDDNFCLKSGRDADGLRVNRPTEYIVIRNCISRAGGGLITCGSETSGGIRYVLADGLKAIGTTVGIRLKSAMNRGGTTEYIYIKNVEMDDVGTVFEATMNWNPAYSYSVLPKEYEGKAIPEHWKKMLEEVNPSQGRPFFNQIYLSGLKVKHAKTFLNVSGSKESMMEHFHFENIDAEVEKIGKINYARDWKLSALNIKPKDKRPVQINNCQGIHFPENNQLQALVFPYKLNANNPAVAIRAAKHPEFAFLFPEIAGNLKFGLVNGKANKWLSEMRIREVKQDASRLVYTLSDPMLQNGELVLEVRSLTDTDGVIIAVRGENIPDRLQLCYSYGGAGGEILSDPKTSGLQPFLCKDNVFSIEQTAFTLYYGTSMELKTVQGILPVHAEIRLADSCSQNSPVAFFESGKKTDFPALAAMIPLKNNTAEYFCIYRQNKKADYNHFMLPELFAKEK